MSVSRAFRLFRVLLAGGTLTLAGCSTTGNQFDTTDLRFLEPGYTTLQEATALLQGEPANVYRQADGSAIARWAYTASLATDAVYFNRELWLAFDSAGTFQRIVKSTNVPHANLYQDGRRVDVPLSSVAPRQWAGPATPVAAPAPVQPPQGAQPAAAQPLPRTAVSYPLSR